MTNITNITGINKLHTYFFYLFLFSIPFQTRKVFLTQYSFYSGAFTEYATFFVYASDIFLILALFFWFVFGKHKVFLFILQWGKNHLSFPRRRESAITVNHSKYKITNKTVKSHKIWLFLAIFIIWLAVDTTINNKYLEISVFQIIKFIELFLLLIYIYFNLADKKVLITSLFVVSLAGFLQSLIAIYQFVYQHSLFNSPILAKITGETIISPQISGIAKIVIDSEKIVRAYGTFPHPNMLGGFLIFSILISIYLLLEHKYTILSRYILDYIQIYNIKFRKSQVQTIISLVWIVIIFAQVTALLFTFSRSAWAGFVISIIVLIIILFHVKQYNIVSRETISCNSDEVENNIAKTSHAFENVSRETFLNFKRKLNCYLLPIFISFLFIGLFDHYFWTLQQGRLIFWFVLGLLLMDIRFKIKNTI